MRRDKDDDIYDFMSSDTLKRAEELCASMSSNLGLERRGQLVHCQGAVSDMAQSGDRFIEVTVADPDQGDTLTLISSKPLPASNNALLVYRPAPGSDRKYLGAHPESWLGKRQEDKDNPHYITRYTILRDIRTQR
ncbi:MAG: hypothetical protein HND55_11350 [Pseudomonadota bacterium]|nr:MAG: hypothetical protein HND55_11350 [Pseudomonadota bacterium]